MLQQTLEQPQQQQLEHIEQQQRPELDIKGGDQQQQQERLPEADDLRQTKEGQNQEKLDEPIKTKRDRVKTPTIQQGEDKNASGF